MFITKRTYFRVIKRPVRDAYYVHPTGGWTYYFCFFRHPASHLVSRHFRQQFLSYLYQIWHAGLLGLIACMGLLLVMIAL